MTAIEGLSREATSDRLPVAKDRHGAGAQRVRVLHVVESLGTGAVERWLLRMLSVSHATTDEIEWTFYTVLREPGTFDRFATEHGAAVIHSPYELKDTVAFVRHLRGVIRGGGFDVLHCHHDVVSALYLMAAIGTPLRQRIVHVHNADLHVPTASTFKAALLRSVFRRVCLRLATDIVGISRHTLEYFVRGSARSGRRDAVLYYGVDTAAFRGVDEGERARLRASWKVEDDTPVLLFTGRMVWYKNPMFVLDVLAELRRTMPNAIAVFAGVGPEVDRVRQRAREIGLESHIRLLGWRSDTPSLMRAADLMVFPRVEGRTRDLGPEGLGFVVVEAQTAGLPMLVSHGIPEDAIVSPELCVRLPLDTGVAAWASDAQRLLRQPRPDAKHAAAAIEGSRFSLANGFQNLRSIYR